MASKKEITFNLSIEDNIHIKAHPNTIDSIINNLVENAIKYTPEKGTIGFEPLFENNKAISHH